MRSVERRKITNHIQEPAAKFGSANRRIFAWMLFLPLGLRFMPRKECRRLARRRCGVKNHEVVAHRVILKIGSSIETLVHSRFKTRRHLVLVLWCPRHHKWSKWCDGRPATKTRESMLLQASCSNKRELVLTNRWIGSNVALSSSISFASLDVIFLKAFISGCAPSGCANHAL
jgi:hypothetical protein